MYSEAAALIASAAADIESAIVRTVAALKRFMSAGSGCMLAPLGAVPADLRVEVCDPPAHLVDGTFIVVREPLELRWRSRWLGHARLSLC